MKNIKEYINESTIEKRDINDFKEEKKFSYKQWIDWIEQIYAPKSDNDISFLIGNDAEAGTIDFHLRTKNKIVHIATFDQNTMTMHTDDLSLFKNKK